MWFKFSDEWTATEWTRHNVCRLYGYTISLPHATPSIFPAPRLHFALLFLRRRKMQSLGHGTQLVLRAPLWCSSQGSPVGDWSFTRNASKTAAYPPKSDRTTSVISFLVYLFFSCRNDLCILVASRLFREIKVSELLRCSLRGNYHWRLCLFSRPPLWNSSH